VTLVAAPWWTRPGLESRDGRLTIAGEDAEHLARLHGTPLFVYDLDRFADNARRVSAALEATGLETRLRFALKANPEPRILEILRPLVGVDACSPGEVERAIECGWRPEEISYTGTNLSERDLDAILHLPLHLNLDAVSQIERVGRRTPGRRIGLRVNPAAGAGYHAGLAYSGDRPTKFGIYEDRLPDAIEAARRHDLGIDTVHFHAGSGWLGRKGSRGSRRRSPGSRRSPGASSTRVTRSRRSTWVGGWVSRPGRRRSRSTSTPTPVRSPDTWARLASRWVASPATTWRRTRRSSWARS
jgi:diaminopimelate decarboxylase